jgi:DNA-binding NtrC family response regulator
MQISKINILVVDDQNVVINVCKTALSINGFQVIVAQDGEEGLRAFYERPDEIDIVLADVSMPKMNGIEMVRRMFAQKPHVRVIVMTTPVQAVPQELKKACGYLEKPFTALQLLEAVEERLERRQ